MAELSHINIKRRLGRYIFFLNKVLQEELEPIRQRRKEFEQDIPAVYEILKKGSEKAKRKAEQTLAGV